jgi:hypothetical protein
MCKGIASKTSFKVGSCEQRIALNVITHRLEHSRTYSRPDARWVVTDARSPGVIVCGHRFVAVAPTKYIKRRSLLGGIRRNLASPFRMKVSAAKSNI